jgi:hypothetical protein
MAFTQEDLLNSLEKMGEWQTAYPLALKWAQQKNSYEAWRDVVLKYQQFDKDGAAYLQAWQQAYQRGDIESLKNFMSLRPQAELNLYAIHAIYQLTEKVGTTTAYREFVEQFPGAIQSVDALLKMQRLFFEEVKQENTVDAYDAFVVFFPYAEQTPSAIQVSYNLEKQAIEQQIHALDCRKEGEEKRLCETEAKDRIARQLLNEARIAEIEANKPVSENDKESEARKIRFSLISARKYSVLLNSSLFNDTKVLTEKLDRDERLTFQHQLLQKQDEVKQAIDDMKIAVVAAIKEQTEILGGKLDTLDKSIQSVEQAIVAHHQQMEAQLSKINQSIEQGNATLAKLHLEQGDVANGSLWSLGEFLVSQTAKIAIELVAPAAVASLMEQNGNSLSAQDIGSIGLTRSFSIPRKGTILRSVCGIGATAGCIALPIFCPIISITGMICRMLPF